MSYDVSTYLEHQVANATPGELVEMLYARAVRDLTGARELFSLQGDPRAQSDAIHLIVHAQQIIAELNHCLNIKEGGSLAVNLARLYEYMEYRLTEAVSKRDDGPVGEVVNLLSELHEAWETIVKQQMTGKSVTRAGAGLLVA
jgi:flagellar secretion chaperone FliS